LIGDGASMALAAGEFEPFLTVGAGQPQYAETGAQRLLGMLAWRIDRLIPYAKNARTHTDAQIAAIAASIKEWGWTTPVLVAEGDRPRARARHCRVRRPRLAQAL
jgi:hypothetical protein